MPAGRFTLEFYQSPDGDEPARRWMQKRLSAPQRRALDTALRLILAVHGVGVCRSSYGRHVGRGLFEFRLDEDEATLLHKWSPASTAPRPATSGDRILLRVFCHAHGDRIVLLLGGYDKGADPSRRKQRLEIARARARLDDFLRRRSSERDGTP
ncbi:MAG TPA: hypothetical protein VIK32_12395 [Candidatus Limnocylindrales bacterium]|jgi:hypothetical protein